MEVKLIGAKVKEYRIALGWSIIQKHIFFSAQQHSQTQRQFINLDSHMSSGYSIHSKGFDASLKKI